MADDVYRLMQQLQRPDVGSIQPSTDTRTQRVESIANMLQVLGLASTARDAFRMANKHENFKSTVGEFLPGESYKLAQERGDKLGQGLAMIDMIPGAGLLTGPVKVAKKAKGIGLLDDGSKVSKAETGKGITALKPTKMDAENISDITDWVDSSKESWTQKNLLKTVGDYDLKNVSKDYLQKNNLLDKDGNVTLYRYLNIPENEALQTEKGIKSLTTDLAHATKMAKERSSLPMQRLKEGETLTQAEKSGLSSPLDIALSGKYETYNLERPGTVLEYKVPLEKIEGYLPAIWKNLDEESLQGYKRFIVEDRYSNLIDDAIEQGLDYDEALEEVANSDAITYFIDDYISTISDESEALVDLTGIKPNKIK